jgi:enediyne biosynthesis protein CalE5
VAGGWGAWLDWTEGNFKPLTDWCREAAGWNPGARILDVACGAGYPALAAAQGVRPSGAVVATDISPEMVAVASRRATAEGLDNIQFLEMDAEDLRFENESFDAATNAYGLMFCPSATRAISEVRRVLKPGGRFAVVTWDEPARNPFFTVIGGVAARFLSLTPPDPGGLGPFRFAPSGKLESELRAGGFAQVHLEALPITVEFGSVAEYCQIFSDYAWKSRVAALSAAQSAQFRDAVGEAAQPYLEGGRLRLVATSLCASGRK